MIIVTIRTDKPEAEIGLYEDSKQLVYETWQAHRELAETIHVKLSTVLDKAGKQLSDIEGIVAFQGPGSFTGLRIGLTVANTLAYAEDAHIVASQGNAWIETGIERLKNNDSDTIALPEYGAEAHITQQKK